MTFPRRLLDEDERVLADQVPHWSTLIRPVAVVLVVLGGVVAGFVTWTSAPPAFGIALAVVLLFAMSYLGAKVLAWRSTNFVITSHRVIFRSGVLHRVGREILIDAICDVSYHQSLFDRALQRGTLRLSATGDRNDEYVVGLRRPEQVQRMINRTVVEVRRPPVAAEPIPAEGIEVQLERLARLCRRGVITETEYEQKRSELIDRF